MLALTVSMEEPPAAMEAGCGEMVTVGAEAGVAEAGVAEAGVAVTWPPPQPAANRSRDTQKKNSVAGNTRSISLNIRNLVTLAVFTLF